MAFLICLKHKSAVIGENSMSVDSLSSVPFSPLRARCSTPRDDHGEGSHCDGRHNIHTPPKRPDVDKLQEVVIELYKWIFVN